MSQFVRSAMTSNEALTGGSPQVVHSPQATQGHPENESSPSEMNRMNEMVRVSNVNRVQATTTTASLMTGHNSPSPVATQYQSDNYKTTSNASIACYCITITLSRSIISLFN